MVVAVKNKTDILAFIFRKFTYFVTRYCCFIYIFNFLRILYVISLFTSFPPLSFHAYHSLTNWWPFLLFLLLLHMCTYIQTCNTLRPFSFACTWIYHLPLGIGFPSIQWLSAILHLQVVSCEISPIHVGMPTGPAIKQVLLGELYCCDFVSAAFLSCLEDTVSQQVSQFSGSHSLSPLFSEMFS